MKFGKKLFVTKSRRLEGFQVAGDHPSFPIYREGRLKLLLFSSAGSEFFYRKIFLL